VGGGGGEEETAPRTIWNRAMKDLDMEEKLGFSPPNAIWNAKAHARTNPIMAPRYLMRGGRGSIGKK
jgi:hypothetical protein